MLHNTGVHFLDSGVFRFCSEVFSKAALRSPISVEVLFTWAMNPSRVPFSWRTVALGVSFICCRCRRRRGRCCCYCCCYCSCCSCSCRISSRAACLAPCFTVLHHSTNANFSKQPILLKEAKYPGVLIILACGKTIKLIKETNLPQDDIADSKIGISVVVPCVRQISHGFANVSNRFGGRV